MTDDELIEKIRLDVERALEPFVLPRGRVDEARVRVDLRLAPDRSRVVDLRVVLVDKDEDS